IYIEYQSKVNWRKARDILRCNSQFHSALRFNSVVYETEGDPVTMGELHFIFQCHFLSGEVLDLAMTRPFRKTSWQPNTPTDCSIHEQAPATSSAFIALEHLVHSALLCPIFGGKAGVHYIIDCI
ncbi:hypothetical protein C8R45DRAFT_765428, partial [Mycena sanguinolenta]